ncbi:MAG: leucyl/phenylalanyl-tRNA--protein transferase [Flavobacteriaceae bacterium]|jgi:leucyl/phenylalanyl-tRNA--protein transferase|nr:leucyl/phenylalanyl-tRNA--protein transferase [Flavobacteriaceae bacterium]MBT3919866.1 leucyl/phenylalanyl-tRNA--protein transferase [Flavobacteriaceae bacterium]MBT6704946.1 leucyl/phenylalanyl-tRNA--protein transferase [Flavobacteriaceae bacterium]MBT7242240.1 leucyl/phenylalanyl-tRNA--protein transferase [Flavobacteriaceae bacterium]|tara:strand:- start:1816 stop:2457 length:642 start_codon:yes stop_codon:yes gene_type:complete
MHHLSNSIWFPNPEEADKEGLLAFGGDLSVKRLMHAYRSGIFPWFDDYQPILWWSPDPRMIMFLDDFKVSKSLEKIIHKNKFTITYNTCFREVIRNCSQIKREGQQGTWITSQMQEAYLQLHELGLATSVEIWLGDELVGGLYGIDLIDKKVFCGESMFSKVSDASKVGFYYLVAQLKAKNYQLIDCQMYTTHLERLGAKEIPRNEFLKHLNR